MPSWRMVMSWWGNLENCVVDTTSGHVTPSGLILLLGGVDC